MERSGQRVTVLIPTRNRAHWLRGSMEAVLAQTWPDLRLLVCDNASTDETADVVAGFDDPRVDYVRQPRDLGLVGNHNDGLARVTSEYVLIVPDDDLIHPTLLERTVDVLDRNPRAGMVHTNLDMIDPDGTPLERDVNWTMGLQQSTIESGPQFIRESMRHSCRVCASTALMRTEALPAGFFDPDDLPPVDLGLWLRMARRWDMVFLAETLAAYRIHDHSHSAAVAQRSSAGYVHDVALIRKQEQVKRRFLERNEPDTRRRRELEALARESSRDLVLLRARLLTVPDRRFWATTRAVAAAVRQEPKLALDTRAWRLLGASLLGGRVTNALLARRTPVS